MSKTSPISPNPETRPDQSSAKVVLPIFHKAQAKLRWLMSQAPRIVARCGRRWGKNVLGESVASDDAAHGRLVGWFAPEHKRLAESYNVIVEQLEPVKKSSSKTEGVIRTINGGRVDFWSLEDEDAGRSRKYHRVIFDEVGFTKPKTINTWKRAVEPTLLDYSGRALFMSNTNGIDADNMLYDICHNPGHGFVQFHAPTMSNPILPIRMVMEELDVWIARRREYFAELIRNTHPLVYQQEYLAEFVDWSGQAFFSLESLLVNGNPVEYPARCEAVFAVVDTATKTGAKHDGTAVQYNALIRHHVVAVAADGTMGPRYSLIILDWDIRQIEGALLETWLPTIAENLQELARVCKAARGSLGVMIEDKNSGSVLLQQAARRNIQAFPIDSKLTAMGKDERAISVSGYVYRGLIKFSRVAFEKTINYKGNTANHLRTQVTGFRVGSKDATREDDGLDVFCYSCAIVFGNEEGF